MTASYRFAISVGQDTANEGAAVVLTDGCGMTDALALDFVRAVKSLPWPAGSGATCSVTRVITESAQAEGNPDTGEFDAD